MSPPAGGEPSRLNIALRRPAHSTRKFGCQLEFEVVKAARGEIPPEVTVCIFSPSGGRTAVVAEHSHPRLLSESSASALAPSYAASDQIAAVS